MQALLKKIDEAEISGANALDDFLMEKIDELNGLYLANMGYLVELLKAIDCIQEVKGLDGNMEDVFKYCRVDVQKWRDDTIEKLKETHDKFVSRMCYLVEQHYGVPKIDIDAKQFKPKFERKSLSFGMPDDVYFRTDEENRKGEQRYKDSLVTPILTGDVVDAIVGKYGDFSAVAREQVIKAFRKACYPDNKLSGKSIVLNSFCSYRDDFSGGKRFVYDCYKTMDTFQKAIGLFFQGKPARNLLYDLPKLDDVLDFSQEWDNDVVKIKFFKNSNMKLTFKDNLTAENFWQMYGLGNLKRGYEK